MHNNKIFHNNTIFHNNKIFHINKIFYFITRTRAEHERLWGRGADGVRRRVARRDSNPRRRLACAPVHHHSPADATLRYTTHIATLYCLNVIASGKC